MHLGIFGVGRSGTTALYAGIQHLILANEIDCHYFYEPYLWSNKVFDQPYSAVKNKFSSTSSLSMEGMYAHYKTPLFTDRKNEIHTQFLSLITKDSPNFLIKAIRGNGRLALFLEQFPELRIVCIIRNPLEAINSVVDLFSFFGDEFHPSDKSRFLDETQREFGVPFDLGAAEKLDEVEWSLLWWRYMNLAALKTASEYRERVLVVAQEAFKENPEDTLHKIGHFVGLDTQTLSSYESKKPVGPVTQRVNLSNKHINLLESQDTEYWQNFMSYSDVPLKKSAHDLREELYRYYRENALSKPTARALVIPTDWGGIQVRSALLRLKRENAELRRQIDQNTTIWEEHFEDEWEHKRFNWMITR